MKTETTPNYTAAQEQIIRDWTGTGTGGALNFADAKAIAADARMNDEAGEARKPRSIVAKITRMTDVSYEKAVSARKDGSPVQSKANLVAEIAKLSGLTFDALDKAGREDLVKLRDVLAA